MNYSDKLKSPKWQKKRLEVLQRDNFTCCKCGDTETELHVHHLKYTKEPHNAHLDDLQTLCKYCHYFVTFYLKDEVSIYELESEEFTCIKKGIAYLYVFNRIISVCTIEDKILFKHCTFNKNSSVIDALYNIKHNLI
jgi:hypothetical protein